MMPTRHPDDSDDDENEYYIVRLPPLTDENQGEIEERINPGGDAHPVDTIEKNGTTVGIIMHEPDVPSLEEQVERMQEVREQMRDQMGGDTDTDRFRID